MLALSQTISHPAFQRATEGFAENGRVYLVYADEELKPLRRGSLKMSEPEAIAAAMQVCQAIAFVHRRALRLNDICPESVAVAKDGRIKLTGLDYVSNDNELQCDPIFNDGYTAPEIYRGKKSRQTRGYFLRRRDSLHLAHRREDSERELARRSRPGAVLSAACRHAAAREGDSPRDRFQSCRALADDRRVQG